MSDYTLPQPASDSRLNIGLLSFDGRYGVPNSLREALLQQGIGEAALLLDALLLCGYLPKKNFTFQKVFHKLREHGFSFGQGLIRRALNSGVFKVVAIYNGRRGRPELLYFMPDMMDLVKQYAGGKIVAMDMLTIPDMQSLKLYRQGLHRQFIRRAPGIYSRRWLGDRLGISRRTTHSYDRAVGIRAICRLRKQNLRYCADWREMIQRGRRGLNWLLIQWNDGRYMDAPLMCGIADDHMWKDGVVVYFITQLCNRYFYAPEADWADYQFLRDNDDERCFPAWDRFGFRKERASTDPVSATLMVDPKAYKSYRPPAAWCGIRLRQNGMIKPSSYPQEASHGQESQCGICGESGEKFCVVGGSSLRLSKERALKRTLKMATVSFMSVLSP